jgi:hypothetical protein
MANVTAANFSVAYAKEMRIAPKPGRKRSPQHKKIPSKRRPSSSAKRASSFREPRKRSFQKLELGVVRISTLDELPIRVNPRYKRKNSLNHDRLSSKSSVTTNSIKQRTQPKDRPQRKHSMKTRPDDVSKSYTLRFESNHHIDQFAM